MKLISAIIIGLLVILTSTSVSATPMADIRYVETELAGGIWQYDYTVFNTAVEPGFDLYDVFLFLKEDVALIDVSVPNGWVFIAFNDFVDTYSLIPGAPPIGTDIAPGEFLGGFIFQFDEKVGDLAFDVIFANPLDPENPIIESGSTLPVPEPSTILLLAAGISGLGFAKRRRLMS